MVKVPPLGECPKDKGGAASGEEVVTGHACQVTEGLHKCLSVTLVSRK